ncbi:hypothetical protein WN943_024083 [Citrus x changshan-huyou]
MATLLAKASSPFDAVAHSLRLGSGRGRVPFPHPLSSSLLPHLYPQLVHVMRPPPYNPSVSGSVHVGTHPPPQSLNCGLVSGFIVISPHVGWIGAKVTSNLGFPNKSVDVF